MSEAKRDFYGDLVGPDRQPEQERAMSEVAKLVEKWRKEQFTYSGIPDWMAVFLAVRTCADELESALRADEQAPESTGGIYKGGTRYEGTNERAASETEDYPGQAFFHENNPNIKRAEERIVSREEFNGSISDEAAQSTLEERAREFADKIAGLLDPQQLATIGKGGRVPSSTLRYNVRQAKKAIEPLALEMLTSVQAEAEGHVVIRIRNVLAVLAGAPFDNLTPEIQGLVKHWQPAIQAKLETALQPQAASAGALSAIKEKIHWYVGSDSMSDCWAEILPLLAAHDQKVREVMLDLLRKCPEWATPKANWLKAALASRTEEKETSHGKT